MGSKKIIDFVSSGKCISVNVPDKIKKLLAYHPKVECNKEPKDSYGAFTKLDDYDKNIIRLFLYPKWSGSHMGKIARLKFKIDKSSSRDLIVAIPKAPIQITGKWFIEKWQIESKKADKDYCDGSIVKPDIMIDTISWIKIDSVKILKVEKEINSNKKNRMNIATIQNKFENSIIRIESKWEWIDKKSTD